MDPLGRNNGWVGYLMIGAWANDAGDKYLVLVGLRK